MIIEAKAWAEDDDGEGYVVPLRAVSRGPGLIEDVVAGIPYHETTGKPAPADRVEALRERASDLRDALDLDWS